MTKMRVTRHSGRVGLACHLDRDFDVTKAQNIDGSLTSQNFTWHCFNDKTVSFEDAEKLFYAEKFNEMVEMQNENARKNRQYDRIKSTDDLLKGRFTRPEEVILEIGKAEDKVHPRVLFEAFRDYMRWHVDKFGSNIHIMDCAVHVDEPGSPAHVHLRQVYTFDDGGVTKIGQERALEELGYDLPKPDQERGRHNNRKQVYTKETREKWVELCEERGISVEKEPQRRAPNEQNLRQGEYNILAQDRKIKEQQRALELLNREVEQERRAKEKAEKEKRNLEKEKREIEIERDKARSEKIKAEREAAELQLKNRDLSDKVDSLSREIDELKKDHVTYDTAIRQEKAQLIEIRTEHKRVSKDMDAMKKTLKTDEKALEKVREHIDQAKDELGEMDKQLAVVSEEVEKAMDLKIETAVKKPGIFSKRDQVTIDREEYNEIRSMIGQVKDNLIKESRIRKDVLRREKGLADKEEKIEEMRVITHKAMNNAQMMEYNAEQMVEERARAMSKGRLQRLERFVGSDILQKFNAAEKVRARRVERER